MNFPAHYLTIKPILDLSLFGIKDAEKTFATNEKLVFRKEFLLYHNGFLADRDSNENEILLNVCANYLSDIDKKSREDIVKVILENSSLCEALIMISMMNDMLFDAELGSIKFLTGLRTFLEENKTNESIILFFQQHFLNFERLEPAKYQNFELTKSEYSHLISDYLKVQTNIF